MTKLTATQTLALRYFAGQGDAHYRANSYLNALRGLERRGIIKTTYDQTASPVRVIQTLTAKGQEILASLSD